MFDDCLAATGATSLALPLAAGILLVIVGAVIVGARRSRRGAAALTTVAVAALLGGALISGVGAPSASASDACAPVSGAAVSTDPSTDQAASADPTQTDAATVAPTESGEPTTGPTSTTEPTATGTPTTTPTGEPTTTPTVTPTPTPTSSVSCAPVEFPDLAFDALNNELVFTDPSTVAFLQRPDVTFTVTSTEDTVLDTIWLIGRDVISPSHHSTGHEAFDFSEPSFTSDSVVFAQKLSDSEVSSAAQAHADQQAQQQLIQDQNPSETVRILQAEGVTNVVTILQVTIDSECGPIMRESRAFDTIGFA